MNRSLKILLLCLTLTGCGHVPAGTAIAAKAATLKAKDAATTPAWTGDWVVGAGDDVVPGARAACMSHFRISQDGPTFHLDADGIPDSGPMPQFITFESADGTLAGDTLTLNGQTTASPSTGLIGMPKPEPLTYVLKLDPATGHLTGTRNDQPFWAAPFQPATGRACMASH